MAVVRINGVKHRVRRIERADIVAGALVKPRENRNVYRVICSDGGDIIVRNVRTPSILVAVPARDLESYLYVESAGY